MVHGSQGAMGFSGASLSNTCGGVRQWSVTKCQCKKSSLTTEHGNFVLLPCIVKHGTSFISLFLPSIGIAGGRGLWGSSSPSWKFSTSSFSAVTKCSRLEFSTSISEKNSHMCGPLEDLRDSMCITFTLLSFNELQRIMIKKIKILSCSVRKAKMTRVRMWPFPTLISLLSWYILYVMNGWESHRRKNCVHQ